MAELSQTLKNFLTQFELEVVPHLNKGKHPDFQPVTCYVSAATLLDPQLRELLGISSGELNGKFFGVTVKAKPDMTVETFYD